MKQKTNNSLFIIHHSIPRSFALSIIRLYQKFLSFDTGYLGKVVPIGKTCRFTPTCSEYTYQAIDRYGILYGLWLGLKRIVRCHPWNPGGWDAVPEARDKGQETRSKRLETGNK